MGYTDSRLRRKITPEEFIRARGQEGKPVLCLLHLREELQREAMRDAGL